MTDAHSYDGRSDDYEHPARRKIQMTGGSTFTVSLPKNWALQHDLEAGMGVEIYPRGEWAAVTIADAGRSPRTVTIRADDRSTNELGRSIAAGYVAGCDEIHVEGVEDAADRHAVREAVAGLVGIEIERESNGILVARTMLDIDELSPVQTLKQIELTALDMHADAVRSVRTADEQLAGEVRAQDDGVDRLFALICRVFQRSLVDVSVPQRSGGLTTFEYYAAARQFERIADHAEKLAGVAHRIEDPPQAQLRTELDDLGQATRDVSRRALHELLGNRELATFRAIIEDAGSAITSARALDRRLYEASTADEYHLGTVVDSLIRTGEYGVNVAEFGIQASLRHPDPME